MPRCALRVPTGPGANGCCATAPAPPFALDHLHQHDTAHLRYDIPKPRPDEDAPHRAAARYLWAMLLARIYEVFPLTCAFCGAEMRIIAFITEPGTVRQMLADLGEPTRSPRFAPARGPPLWEAAMVAAASSDPAWDHTPPPDPDLEFDQRITW